MSYYYKKTTPLLFDEAVAKLKAALAAEGFGVLTNINVQETLKKKLNTDFKPYLILGACNPSFAYEALQAEADIGLMLPCNLIVYIENDETVVATILPSRAMSSVDNPKLTDIAVKVEKKLIRVIDGV